MILSNDNTRKDKHAEVESMLKGMANSQKQVDFLSGTKEIS
jgi:hypothetical protein